MPRLSIDITPEEHQKLKAIAALQRGELAAGDKGLQPERSVDIEDRCRPMSYGGSS
jgi:hypothetical protein